MAALPGGTTLLLFVAALAALGVLAYYNSFNAQFLLDDKSYIRDDPAIKPPVSLRGLLGNPRPVVAASLAINYGRGGLEVFGYHVMNLLLHVACGAVVFVFARLTLLQPVMGERYTRHANALAFVAASVFLLHPIQTESVTYIIQRAEIFAAIWLLGGVYLAALAARAERRFTLLVSVAAVGVLGIWSKPSVVVLPVLFALYDWCFIAEGRWRDMAERRWLYLLLCAIAVGTFLWGMPTEESPTTGAHDQGLMAGIGRWRYLSWQFGVILYYLQLIFVPDRLCFDCGYLGPWPVQSSWIGTMVWVPAALLAAGGAVAWLARPRYPLATFCILGGAIALAPTSSLMPLADVYVEHRLYLPIAFLALGAVVALYDSSEWLGRRMSVPTVLIRAGQLGAAAAVGGVLLWLTVDRNIDYSDIIRLLEDSALKAPMSRRVHYNLGNEYARANESEKAIAAYQQAIRINDTAARNFVNMGVEYQKLGRYAEAAEAFEAAAKREPGLGLAHSNLANAYEHLGETSKAVSAMERAVRAKPGNAAYHKRLGALYQAAGRNQEALRSYETAQRMTPGDADLKQRIGALSGQAN